MPPEQATAWNLLLHLWSEFAGSPPSQRFPERSQHKHKSEYSMISSTNCGLDLNTQQVVANLIRINVDSRDGYHDAARQVHEEEAKELLESLAERRASNVRVLRDVLQSYECEVIEHGSILARMHRVWVSLRATLSKEMPAILSEAVAAEDYVRLQYIDALKLVSARSLRQLLQEQLHQLTEDAGQLQLLRDQVVMAE